MINGELEEIIKKTLNYVAYLIIIVDRCGKQNMERHRDNIHAEKINKKEENDGNTATEDEELGVEEVTKLDIATDYYNRLIIELSQQSK